ncbi:hypothetical protein A3754_01375 [Alcanivorax sp. HI0083]|nr:MULTISPECIES: TIGR04219 family outer membrane beta-barrel protein [unclassified Alcanivorax]KZY33002.1 hypothetical protein A3730_04245 [Alcanivorax sp. HI0044]KZZ27009.1 hypothetical protein A3754_01375 [Alcanivorax sp. HI0083]
MKRAGLLVTALLATPLAHAAPGVAIYGGGYTWDTELEGNVASGGANIDVQDDLGFNKADQNVLYLGVEHAVPLVPNVRLRYIDLSDSASNIISRSFTFNGQNFVANTRVATDFDLEMLDGTLYYSPLNNAVKVDLGLTLRRLDGELRLNSLAGKTSLSIDETLPMLHAGARAQLPVPGVYVGAELNAIAYDGNKMNDYNARVGWRSDYLFGLELGYSQMNIVLDDVNNLDTDLDVGGPYIAISLGF